MCSELRLQALVSRRESFDVWLLLFWSVGVSSCLCCRFQQRFVGIVAVDVCRGPSIIRLRPRKWKASSFLCSPGVMVRVSVAYMSLAFMIASNTVNL